MNDDIVSDVVTVSANEQKLVVTKPVIENKQTKPKRMQKQFHCKDEDVVIPHKIKCSKCGKLVSGYPNLIYKRIMDHYDGSWERYQKEWQCSECVNAEKRANKVNHNNEIKAKKIAAAIELLEDNGFNVTK